MAQQMRKPKRVLVGLKTLENAVELTTLACRLGSRGASLVLVHVIELPDNTRSRRRSTGSGSSSAENLARRRARGPPQPFKGKNAGFAGTLRQLRPA